MPDLGGLQACTARVSNPTAGATNSSRTGQYCISFLNDAREASIFGHVLPGLPVVETIPEGGAESVCLCPRRDLPRRMSWMKTAHPSLQP